MDQEATPLSEDKGETNTKSVEIKEQISYIIKEYFKKNPSEKPDISISQKGQDKQEIIERIKQIGLQGPQIEGKKYLSQLFSGIQDLSLVADMAASLFNSPMHTVKASGIHLHIENEVIQHVASKIGFKDGIISPGGSLSNLTAMIIARYVLSQSKNSGITQQLRVYVCDQAHYSIIKNAGITGIGRDNVVFIPTHASQMDQSILRQRILEDKENGYTPLMIISTAGTTMLGRFEDLEGVDAIAKEFGLWHHVDGAFGGTVLFSSEHKHQLKGLENCDSFTWDAHKLFSVPLPCSLLLTKREDVLSTLSEDAEYLFSDNYSKDAGHKSIQCARRNDALKLWALFNLGEKYLEQLIDGKIEIAKYAAQQIKNHSDLTLLARPELPIICFRSESKNAYQRLTEYGIRCSEVTYEGMKWTRISLINSEFTKKNVDQILALLN